MTNSDTKQELHLYLRGARETLVWKLDGLSEYDMRRPLTPTGTNLLGLVKHSTATHLGYFGEVFGRAGDTSPRRWRARRRRTSATSRAARFTGDAEPNAEFWATPDESCQDIIMNCRAAWDVSDATISELPLDAVGRVPWWGDATVTLLQVLVHVTSETQRHAGHADIVRELIDGSVGLLNGHDNLHISDPADQRRFREQVEAAAGEFRGRLLRGVELAARAVPDGNDPATAGDDGHSDTDSGPEAGDGVLRNDECPRPPAVRLRSALRKARRRPAIVAKSWYNVRA